MRFGASAKFGLRSQFLLDYFLGAAKHRLAPPAPANGVKAEAAHAIIKLPTGDGMALVFFGDPEAPAKCAVELSRSLGPQDQFSIRMGLHSGPVYRIADINANTFCLVLKTSMGILLGFENF